MQITGLIFRVSRIDREVKSVANADLILIHPEVVLEGPPLEANLLLIHGDLSRRLDHLLDVFDSVVEAVAQL